MVKTQSPLSQLMDKVSNGPSKLALTKSNSGSYVEDEETGGDYGDYADLLDSNSKLDLKKLERSEAIKRMRANEEEIACQLCGKKLMNRVSLTEKTIEGVKEKYTARKGFKN